MSLFDLIPAPYRWLAAGAALVIAAAVGAWGGHQATQAYYQPMVAKAEARAEEFEGAYGQLATATHHQNEAINQLTVDARIREEKAATAVAQARAAAAPNRDRATAIMGLKRPPGADICRAARDAFDDELKQERGR